MTDRKYELREILSQEFRKTMDMQKQMWRSEMRRIEHEEDCRNVFEQVPKEYRKPLRGI